MGTLEEQLKHIELKATEILSEVLKVDAVQESLFNILDAGFGEKAGGSGIAKLCTDLTTFYNEECPPPIDGPQSTVQPATQDASQKQDQKDTALVMHEAGVKAIVNYLAHKKNHLQAQLIAQILHYLAINKIISAKCVCFALLAHENLKPDNATYWVGSFKLIKLIIPGVYYKGVREIMKIYVLEKARLLPAHLKHSQLEPANALCDLLETIFDRNASLLPGILLLTNSLNSTLTTRHGHIGLSRMLTNFIDECRKATQMLSITGRHRLRPIVEHSGHSSPSICSWKLDSTTLKFPLKGALPYSKNLQESQTSLLKHVFRQPYSKEMILAMLDLVKKIFVLEEQIVDLFVESLEECATSDANYFANAAASNAFCDQPYY
ncbi:Mediator of RNA polymerase II transcription subunit 23 [Armadillidium vulgare]|nr:Mediator of RNA polymerase II transcription subunit 23 [Armadillidium vulgare]